MTETKHLKTKICLIGEKAAGKTSLIRRYVLNMFDEQYVTTIGTRVSKKEVRVLLPERDHLAEIDRFLREDEHYVEDLRRAIPSKLTGPPRG